MNNSNSFIMRDQVGDVVRSLMEEERGIPFVRYLSQISIIAMSAIVLF